jgi:hypothetical protein
MSKDRKIKMENKRLDIAGSPFIKEYEAGRYLSFLESSSIFEVSQPLAFWRNTYLNRMGTADLM